MKISSKDRKKSLNKSLKNNIVINTKQNNLNTVINRLNRIKDITDGNIQITDIKIKYPLKLEFIPNQCPVLKPKNTPYNLISWFDNNRDISLLATNFGSFGIPYQLCFNNCLSKFNYKVGLKIIVIEKDDPQIQLIEQQSNNFFLDLINNRDNFDLNNPEEIITKNISLSFNVELQMIYLLKKIVIKNQTPHVNLPILAFGYSLKKLYNNYRFPLSNFSKYLDYCNVLMSEWCFYGSLKDFLKYKNDHIIKKYLPNIIFQLVYTLMVIQEKYPSFRHNDLHLGNILVDIISSKSKILYQVIYKNKKYNFLLPNLGFQIRIWDFDFSCINRIINNYKINNNQYLAIGISQKMNRYYDLFTFCFELWFNYRKSMDLSCQLFLKKSIFKHLNLEDRFQVNRRLSRVIISKELTTPKDIILSSIFEDNLLSQFLVKDNLNNQDCFEIYKIHID